MPRREFLHFLSAVLCTAEAFVAGSLLPLKGLPFSDKEPYRSVQPKLRADWAESEGYGDAVD